MIRWVPLVLAGCGGCGPGGDSGSPTGTGAGTGSEVFASLVAEDLPGVILSAAGHGDEVLMVGGQRDIASGTLARWQGDRICVEEGVADGELWWVHVNAPGDWWAVGEHGIVLREVGGARTREDVPTEATLFGVFDDGSSVWAVGGHVFSQPQGTGELWRRDAAGGAWELFDTTDGLLFKVWEDWVVGDGIAARIGPTGLEHLTLPGGERITTVRGRDKDGDVYLVGGVTGAVMLHYDGSAFSEVEVPALCASRDLMGVWTAPGEDVYISGGNGAMARFDGTDWACPDFPIYFNEIHAVTRHQGEVFFVGGNMLASEGPYLGVVAQLGAHPALPVEPCAR